MASEPGAEKANCKRTGARLWLTLWRLGLLFLGLAGLLVALIGLFYFVSSLVGVADMKPGEAWLLLLMAGFGLLFVAVAIKGWRVRARDELVAAEDALRQRLKKLEDRINR